MQNAFNIDATETAPQEHTEAITADYEGADPATASDDQQAGGTQYSRFAKHRSADIDGKESSTEPAPLSTFVGLPTLSSDPTNQDLREWLAGAQAVTARGRDAASTAVSLIVLAARLKGRGHDNAFFEEFLAEKGLAVPKSKWRFAPAAIAVSLLDVKDENAERRRAARQQIDRDAAAAEALDQRAQDEDPELFRRADASSVTRLNQIIEKAGGVTKLAAEMRSPERRAKREHVIALDPARQRKIAIDRALSDLGAVTPEEDPHVVLAVPGDAGGGDKTLSLEGEGARQVLGAADRSQTEVAILGELFIACQSIQEEETGIPVDRDDDPEDPDTKMRLTRRQYTILRNGDLVCFTILQDSSIIVKVHPHQPLVKRILDGDVKFETRKRIEAEANLLDPSRRSAFTLREEDAPGTLAPLRLTISTEAAQKEADRERDVGFLLQTHLGEMQLDVAEKRISPSTSGTITRRAWRRRHRNHVEKLALLKNGERVVITHRVSSRTWAIDVPKRESYEEDVQCNGSDVTIRTLASDFRLASEAICKLPISGEIEFQIDGQGLMLLAFSTSLADYRMFIPMASVKGYRSDRFMCSFEPHRLGNGVAQSEPEEGNTAHRTKASDRDEDRRA
ncbi:hypothetical protein ACU4GR_00985 [Methylobacterium oryzae CBMB20]